MPEQIFIGNDNYIAKGNGIIETENCIICKDILSIQEMEKHKKGITKGECNKCSKHIKDFHKKQVKTKMGNKL